MPNSLGTMRMYTWEWGRFGFCFFFFYQLLMFPICSHQVLSKFQSVHNMFPKDVPNSFTLYHHSVCPRLNLHTTVEGQLIPTHICQIIFLFSCWKSTKVFFNISKILLIFHHKEFTLWKKKKKSWNFFNISTNNIIHVEATKGLQYNL